MPKKMLTDLKKNSKNSYCLDLSEYMRSVIRKKGMEYAFPYKSEIAKIHASVKRNEENKKANAKKELFKEIQKFLEVDK
jgi:hypothetical protein